MAISQSMRRMARFTTRARAGSGGFMEHRGTLWVAIESGRYTTPRDVDVDSGQGGAEQWEAA